MPVVAIDGSKIHDFDSFHTVFTEPLGFPEFYVRNMNHWDCPQHSGSNEPTIKRWIEAK